MMHRCISGGVGGQCLCGMAYHCGGLQTNSSSSSSSSMFFNSDPPPPPDHSYNYSSYQQTNYYNSCPSPSSSVDCTLSLGTPSTRLTIADDDHHHHNRTSSSSNNRRSSGNYVSNFCWDILKGGSSSSSKSRGNHNNNNNNQNNDPTLLARRCANCDTTSTPLWRNGPRGPKSLCNACGIRFKKEERRASAAAASSSSVQTMEHHQQQYYGYGAGTTSSSSSKMGCYSPAGEFRFIDDSSDVYDHQYHHHPQVVSDQTAGIPSFLSWRLNITDRPALVHDFTR